MQPSFSDLKKKSAELSLLYVEDDTILREKTEGIFKNLFKEVLSAKDGIEGLELYNEYFKEHKKYVDIIVTDIQMPRLDGICLSKEILNINHTQKIIIISAYSDKEYLLDLINLGVDAFMQKPISSTNMLETFLKVCDSFAQEKLVSLSDTCTFNLSKKILLIKGVKVELCETELKFLQLMVQNQQQSFSAVEIFNHIYFDEPAREFSADSIKSLVKRLRKKLPENLIKNTQQLGYSINLF
jgi:DNA-binding response OmpR family regulator